MNKVFLFVGLILIGAGIVVFLSINNSQIIVQGPNHQALPMETQQTVKDWVKYGLLGLLGGLGLIFLIVSLRGMAVNAKMTKLMNLIVQTGVDAEGTVTFVDKNFLILINHQPIYSIVEYKYQDTSGREYIRRTDTVNSELVIRNKIEVGGKIKIKYLQNDPSLSVMLLQ